NAAVRQKLSRLDPADRVIDEPAKLFALFFGDSGAQILNLDQSFPDKDDLGDVRNASHPRVTDQLRVEHQQSIRFFRVPTRGGLPFDQATHAVHLSDRVDVSDEVIALWQRPCEFDLQVPPGLANADAVVLGEAVEQLDALLKHAVPGRSVRVLEIALLVCS